MLDMNVYLSPWLNNTSCNYNCFEHRVDMNGVAIWHHWINDDGSYNNAAMSHPDIEVIRADSNHILKQTRGYKLIEDEERWEKLILLI